MRFFATEGGARSLMVEPLRIVAEYVGGGNLDDPTGHRKRPDDLTEPELLAVDGGRQALAAWRAADDSAHECAIRAELRTAAFDDELIAAGREARPGLHVPLRAATDADEIDAALAELRKAGAEAMGLDR
jgi:hypothetical protein